MKIRNVQFKIQNAKLAHTQARINFTFRFVISDVYLQLFLLSAYARDTKVQYSAFRIRSFFACKAQKCMRAGKQCLYVPTRTWLMCHVQSKFPIEPRTLRLPMVAGNSSDSGIGQSPRPAEVIEVTMTSFYSPDVPWLERPWALAGPDRSRRRRRGIEVEDRDIEESSSLGTSKL